MFFDKSEKVFSLSGTSDVIIRADIKLLWTEFFSYLLVAGFYKEGEDVSIGNIVPTVGNLSDDKFELNYANKYNSDFAYSLSKGLRERFYVLYNHSELRPKEKVILDQINGIFSHTNPSYIKLSAKDILWIAISRDFTDDNLTIAHYTSLAYGQCDFPNEATLPRLYLSSFGNIHLSREDFVKVNEPEIKYRQKLPSGDIVTPLWSFISSQLDTIMEADFPGNLLVDMLTTLSFLNNLGGERSFTTIPALARSCYISNVVGFTKSSASLPANVISEFYFDFLYGSNEHVPIVNHAVFGYIVDLMVKKTGGGDSHQLFPPSHNYTKLLSGIRKRSTRSASLEYALEALDSDLEPTEGDTDIDDGETSSEEIIVPEEDPTRDPSTEDGGYDPSTPPPAMPVTSPTMDEDNIDQDPSAATEEDIDEEYLYRRVVVALNDRCQNDDSVPIKAEVKDALNYWVNGFLYTTAISATKERIRALGLQAYLKNVLVKG